LARSATDDAAAAMLEAAELLGVIKVDAAA